MSLAMSTKCTLCGSNCPSSNLLVESDKSFCCKGCQVVYNILSAQEALDNFQSHPIYQQAFQAGLISSPQDSLSKDKEACSDDDYKKLHLTIQNMWCPSCAQVIHLILIKNKGVDQCVVDYSNDIAIIRYSPRFITQEKIIHLIEKMGYQPYLLQDPRQNKLNRSLSIRFIVAVFCSLNVMMFAYPIYATYFDTEANVEYAKLFAWLSFLTSLPVLLFSGWPIWRRCYNGIKVGVWGMETLISIGVAAATGLSLYQMWQGSHAVYFDSMTVIIMFVLLGKMIEARAKFSAKDALIQLSFALPRRGRKQLQTGESNFVPIEEFQIGDLLIVHGGEKIVLDGIVEEGRGVCDESLMTGESFPVQKEKGSRALAGTFLLRGTLFIIVTSTLEQTALKHIINTVGQEIEHKSRYIRSADQIVRWFVPIVVFLAIMTALICLLFGISDGEQTVLQTALIRAISVLLISCPCAIGIAAPLAESTILNIFAKNGVIIRNRGCLPYLGNENVFVFDKTGTITEGKFIVIQGIENLSFDQKRILKGLTSQSMHPISLAIQQALLCLPYALDEMNELIGYGLEGTFEGLTYRLGSAIFMKNNEIHVIPNCASNAEAILTTVYFAKGSECLTTLVLGDQLKTHVKEFITQLNPTKTLLVSGDGVAPVSHVAKSCGIEDWYASYHPLQKKELIDSLKQKGSIVAMLGDGVNDAPALTAAHIGIAVASATDISTQVSDIIMTTQNFRVLSLMRRVGKRGQKIIRQNLFWAFFYNCIGLGLAVAGILTPLFAAFAMVASSLFVLINTQRLNAISK